MVVAGTEPASSAGFSHETASGSSFGNQLAASIPAAAPLCTHTVSAPVHQAHQTDKDGDEAGGDAVEGHAQAEQVGFSSGGREGFGNEGVRQQFVGGVGEAGHRAALQIQGVVGAAGEGGLTGMNAHELGLRTGLSAGLGTADLPHELRSHSHAHSQAHARADPPVPGAAGAWQDSTVLAGAMKHDLMARGEGHVLGRESELLPRTDTDGAQDTMIKHIEAQNKMIQLLHQENQVNRNPKP